MCLKGNEPTPKDKLVNHDAARVDEVLSTLEKDDFNNCNDLSTNVDVSELWQIHGRYYDISDSFVKVHPGGSHAILLGKGKDCTALFESYHPFTIKHTQKVLANYEVRLPLRVSRKDSNRPDGSGEVELKPLEIAKPRDEFYEIMKKRVDKCLRDNGIDPIRDRCATTSRLLYYTFVVSCAIFTGYLHCKGNIITGSFLFGVFGWMIGSLGHDGGHFSVHRNPMINKLSVNGMFLLCNPIMWQYQHTYAHHSHTNDFDKDPDLHHFTVFMRYHKEFKYRKIDSRQKNFLHVLFSYTFTTLGENIEIPIGVLWRNSLYDVVKLDPKSLLQKLCIALYISSYALIVIVAPCVATSSLFKGMLRAVVHMMTTGLQFAFFSQINHINEASIIAADYERRRENSPTRPWSVTQVETSNNFASGSYFWLLYANGLNLQIEHHLFPGLNHCHLPLIAPVVKATCEEFGVCYRCYETWSELFGATLQWMKKLGNENFV